MSSLSKIGFVFVLWILLNQHTPHWCLIYHSSISINVNLIPKKEENVNCQWKYVPLLSSAEHTYKSVLIFTRTVYNLLQSCLTVFKTPNSMDRNVDSCKIEIDKNCNKLSFQIYFVQGYTKSFFLSVSDNENVQVRFVHFSFWFPYKNFFILCDWF